jgi:hypothetical protein
MRRGHRQNGEVTEVVVVCRWLLSATGQAWPGDAGRCRTGLPVRDAPEVAWASGGQLGVSQAGAVCLSVCLSVLLACLACEEGFVVAVQDCRCAQWEGGTIWLADGRAPRRDALAVAGGAAGTVGGGDLEGCGAVGG